MKTYDCIIRQAAIDAIWDGVNMDIYTREVKECLENLPSVTPKPKTGQWLEDGTLTCSNCGCIVYPFEIENGEYNFCPTCGSRNEE